MKPNLLLVEPYTLTTMDSGGKLRIAHTIKALSKRFNLEVKWLPPKQKHCLSFVSRGIPYWFSDWDYRRDLGQVIGDAPPSQIVVEFSQLLYLIDYLPQNVATTFVAHDIATISFWRRLIAEKNLFKKMLHFIRWIEVHLYERKYLPRYDRVIAVSEHDAQKLKKIFGLKHVQVIENGIEKVNFLPPRPKDGHINLGFIGSASHPPNQQAIDFLINTISPALNQQHVNHNLVLAGNNSNIGKHIINLGRVDDVTDFYRQIDFLVAPIFAGSGSRIKILESLSYGRPVITTQVGAEGIQITDDYLRIIDSPTQYDPESWIDAITKFVINPPSNNLKNLLSQLTWENLLKKF